MDGINIDVIEVLFHAESGVFSVHINIWVLLIVGVIIATLIILNRRRQREGGVYEQLNPIKLKYKLGGVEVDYEIVRNYQNLEIAHKIYIELITRKAAMEIEQDKDVIVEVYNSWYALFQITRMELKTLKGEILHDNHSSAELVRLLTDILNKGLRPHLTEYQAKFRRWYDEALDKADKEKSPQEVQRGYVEYSTLIQSMLEVNKTLIAYAGQLKKIIDNEG